jgi:hypothetical protein
MVEVLADEFLCGVGDTMFESSAKLATDKQPRELNKRPWS